MRPQVLNRLRLNDDISTALLYHEIHLQVRLQLFTLKRWVMPILLVRVHTILFEFLGESLLVNVFGQTTWQTLIHLHVHLHDVPNHIIYVLLQIPFLLIRTVPEPSRRIPGNDRKRSSPSMMQVWPKEERGKLPHSSSDLLYLFYHFCKLLYSSIAFSIIISALCISSLQST